VSLERLCSWRRQKANAPCSAERREILLQVPKFIPSLVNVSVAYHWLNTTTMCMNLYAQLVQAVPSLDYPAMQLPGIDIEQAKMLMEKGISGQGWQKKVVGDAEVEKLVGGEGIRIAKEFPQLHVSDAKFEGGLLLNAHSDS
jgi:preprotein translocase subunit Sec63